MNFFDLLFTFLWIGFAIQSYFQGLARSLVGVTTVAVGLFLAESFYQKSYHPLVHYVKDVEQSKLFTYIGIFTVCVVAGMIVNSIIKTVWPGFLNKLPGRILAIGFGGVKGVLIALFIYYVVNFHLPSFQDDLVVSYYYNGMTWLRELLLGIMIA